MDRHARATLVRPRLEMEGAEEAGGYGISWRFHCRRFSRDELKALSAEVGKGHMRTFYTNLLPVQRRLGWPKERVREWHVVSVGRIGS